MKKRTALTIARAALIAALYVILTYLCALLGLSSGVIQLRVSEMLCILPAFLPEAIPGLALGCLLANLLTGAVPMDLIFGTLATLLGAVGAYLLARVPKKLCFLIPLPTIIANTLILPPILLYAYGAEQGYLFTTVSVFIGEFLSAGVLGVLFYLSVAKNRHRLFPDK